MLNESISSLSNDEIALLTKVSRLYYEQSIRQPEIADRLALSQSRVSRLLKQAQDVGIVRITVVSPVTEQAELAAHAAEGNLTRSDPNQPVISGLEVVTPAPKEIPAR